jgi:hypothetical protein
MVDRLEGDGSVDGGCEAGEAADLGGELGWVEDLELSTVVARATASCSSRSGGGSEAPAPRRSPQRCGAEVGVSSPGLLPLDGPPAHVPGADPYMYGSEGRAACGPAAGAHARPLDDAHVRRRRLAHVPTGNTQTPGLDLPRS